jgi:hypothetical protein
MGCNIITFIDKCCDRNHLQKERLLITRKQCWDIAIDWYLFGIFLCSDQAFGDSLPWSSWDLKQIFQPVFNNLVVNSSNLVMVSHLVFTHVCTNTKVISFNSSGSRNHFSFFPHFPIKNLMFNFGS